MSIESAIRSNYFLKKLAIRLLTPRNENRPRLWVKLFLNPFRHQKGYGSIIRKRTRLDVFPYNKFQLGADSTIEDFATVNNAVGDVIIGERSILGLGSVIIGPVEIGDNVMIAQNAVLSGLNHGYEDVTIPPSQQDITCDKIVISDNVWIGANTVITPGVTLGEHCVIGAGSVVTRNIPGYSVAVGNPAKVIKQYNKASGTWESINNISKTNNLEKH
jgi:acetyltransferase-like isoleucine patch superfamily enzyme